MFDFEYLRQTFSEFREKVGQREWMVDVDRRTALLGSLFYAAGNTNLTPDQRVCVQAWLEAAVEDFSRRCAHVDVLGVGSLR